MLGWHALASMTLILAASTAVDVDPRPMEPIPPGTVIGDGPPRGWTDLVLFATPRIGAGDVDQAPSVAASYASLFRFAVLARVGPGEDGGRVLEKVAIGTALDIQGRNVVADADHTFGADLGLIGRSVLAENVRILKDDFRQVARTATMVVFDVDTYVRRAEGHKRMVLRHVVLASSATGKISTFAWLLAPDPSGGYALAERGLQKLPLGFREDRVLSVDGGKFTLGIPSSDAFALAKVPQGTALGYSDALRAVAATRRFSAESARKLEAELQARYAPVAARSKVGSPALR